MEIEQSCYLSIPCQHYVTTGVDRVLMDGNQITLLIDDTHPMYNHFKEYLQKRVIVILNKKYHPRMEYSRSTIPGMLSNTESLSYTELKEIIDGKPHPCICNNNHCKFK